MIKATYKRLIIKKNFEKKWLQAEYKLRTGLNKSVFWSESIVVQWSS
jgi:hypothetical protein